MAELCMEITGIEYRFMGINSRKIWAMFCRICVFATPTSCIVLRFENSALPGIMRSLPVDKAHSLLGVQ